MGCFIGPVWADLREMVTHWFEAMHVLQRKHERRVQAGDVYVCMHARMYMLIYARGG
jgi:hypothetical protein